MNENRMRLIHWGAWREDSVAVLDSGGVAVPGGSATHLNQGVTAINGTGTLIVVPDSLILAIDGILTTDNPTGNNSVETTGNGTILIEGYLNDVEVIGRTRIGDLIINGSDTNTTGCLAVGKYDDTAELYGRLTLKNHGILLPNRGRLKMYPGAEIAMNGERDVTITDAGTLETGFDCAITTTAGRRLVVDSGTTLLVPKGIRTRFECGVLVRRGGLFLIDSGAVVDIREFAVEKGGTMTAQPGSLVSLTSAEPSVCEGALRLNGTAANRVRLIGKAEDCCEEVCDSVIQRSTVRVIGDVADTAFPLASASIEYADVSNVAIRAENGILYPVRESNFGAHRDIFGGGALLEKIYTRQGSGGASFFTWFTRTLAVNLVFVENCSFFDEGEKIERDIDTNVYSVNGARFLGVNALAQFEGCSFDRLAEPILSVNGGMFKVNACTFDSCDFGVHDLGSIPYLCANEFREVPFGTVLTGSKAGWGFDNLYDSSVTAWHALNGLPQRLRGNSFQRYDVGVAVTRNQVYLNTEPTTNGNGYETLGRNVFFVPQSLTARFDIAMLEQISSRATISCGYNDFALNSTYHLFSDVPRTMPVESNKFRDPTVGHVVRPFNVTPAGTPINVRETLDPQCDTVHTPDSCGAAPSSICVPDPWWNDGHWTVHPRTDPILDTFYMKAREDMLDTNLYWECRVIRARDAMQGATMGRVDLVEERFGELRDDYTEIEASASNHATLRSTALSLKGEVYERWGKTDSAVGVYEDIVAGYAGADSISAEWSLHYIEASEIDPDYGPAYDSAMSAWQGRVFIDLIAMIPTGGSPKPVPGEGRIGSGTVDVSGIATLEQNVPNPFAGTTMIPFTLREERTVRLVVTDERGRTVAVPLDGPMSVGRHEVEVSIAGLPNGTYFYTLEVEGDGDTARRVTTRTMTLQR